ncbi:MAG: hypothetical protein KAV99_05590, partial [Candidatus Latescibacteria bacterium]|nr:hypothetical protein [Candidatus Latescibacterota bacterium]
MNISIVPVLEGGQSYGDQVSYGWEAVVRKHLGTYPIHLSGFGASDPVTVPQAPVAAGYYLRVVLEEWRGPWPDAEKVRTLIEHEKIQLEFKRTVGGHHV